MFSSLFSQPEEMIGLIKKHKYNLTTQHLEEFVNIIDEVDFGKNIFFENQQKKISETFDIIDYIITTPVTIFLPKEKNIYSYNSYGKKNSTLTQFWDTSSTSFVDGKWINGAWVNSWQRTYTYDLSGNRTSMLSEDWIEENWVNSWQRTYTYDLSGNRTSVLSEKWIEENWVNSWRETYTYDSNGNMISSLSESWIKENWKNSNKYTYTYDLSGNRISMLSEDWIEENWVNSWRKTYTYDSNGNMISSLSEIWTKENWKNSNKYTYTYDLFRNRTSMLIKEWIGEKWEYYARATYTYDFKGKWTSYLYETWINKEWKPGDGDYFDYELFGNYYLIGGGKTEIFYKTITDINKSNSSILNYSLSQNYPNPFNPTTTIEYSISVVDESFASTTNVVLKVYDVLGHEVTTIVNKKQKPGNYKVQFDASTFPSGIYFYELQKGNFRMVKKMILLK